MVVAPPSRKAMVKAGLVVVLVVPPTLTITTVGWSTQFSRRLPQLVKHTRLLQVKCNVQVACGSIGLLLARLLEQVA